MRQQRLATGDYQKDQIDETQYRRQVEEQDHRSPAKNHVTDDDIAQLREQVSQQEQERRQTLGQIMKSQYVNSFTEKQQREAEQRAQAEAESRAVAERNRQIAAAERQQKHEIK